MVVPVIRSVDDACLVEYTCPLSVATSSLLDRRPTVESATCADSVHQDTQSPPLLVSDDSQPGKVVLVGGASVEISGTWGASRAV